MLSLAIGLVIESITNSREPQPGFEAIYMIMPTTANVDRVIRDFSNGKQQYAGAHLFFIEGWSLLICRICGN
jgi:syntaxin-binding protein 1